MHGSHALPLAERRPIPIRIGRGALGPAVMLAGMFALFGLSVGLPVANCMLLGAVGGPVSLLFHEIGHARAAQRLAGIRSASISLIWLGAATRLDGSYRSGREQMRVAIAGPRASFLLALALTAFTVLPISFEARETLLLLAVFNVALGVLNLVPAYPLDGHKLVVGLLWSATGSEPLARRIVRRVGIAWLAVELVATSAIFVTKPEIGLLVATAAGILYGQNRLVRRARR